MIYWKCGFHFGKTDEEGIKRLQRFSYKVKTISLAYYIFLNTIKYILMLILLPLILVGLTVMTGCKLLIYVLDVPVNKYIKYFLN